MAAYPIVVGNSRVKVDIRDNSMLDCGDILSLKEVMHTWCLQQIALIWKQSCIHYIVGKLGNL